MFDWFKKNKDSGNVIDFPVPKSVPPVPYVEPPKQEEPAKIFYRLGVTDKNRVAFSMGMSELTMNKEGVQNLIEQLQVFRDQLRDEDDEE